MRDASWRFVWAGLFLGVHASLAQTPVYDAQVKTAVQAVTAAVNDNGSTAHDDSVAILNQLQVLNDISAYTLATSQNVYDWMQNIYGLWLGLAQSGLAVSDLGTQQWLDTLHQDMQRFYFDGEKLKVIDTDVAGKIDTSNTALDGILTAMNDLVYNHGGSGGPATITGNVTGNWLTETNADNMFRLSTRDSVFKAGDESVFLDSLHKSAFVDVGGLSPMMYNQGTQRLSVFKSGDEQSVLVDKNGQSVMADETHQSVFKDDEGKSWFRYLPFLTNLVVNTTNQPGAGYTNEFTGIQTNNLDLIATNVDGQEIFDAQDVKSNADYAAYCSQTQLVAAVNQTYENSCALTNQMAGMVSPYWISKFWGGNSRLPRATSATLEARDITTSIDGLGESSTFWHTYLTHGISVSIVSENGPLSYGSRVTGPIVAAFIIIVTGFYCLRSVSDVVA